MNFQNDALLRLLEEEGGSARCGCGCGGLMRGINRRASCPRGEGASDSGAGEQQEGCHNGGCAWQSGTVAEQTGKCLAGSSLAMVYAPWQSFEELYEPEEALCRGTLFKALDKPFCGGRGK